MNIVNENVLAVRPTKTIFRDGDTVVKLFNKSFSKADVLNEALNQARVEQTGLNIPRILEVMTIDGCWAFRSDYIPGQTLQQMIDDNPEKLDYYMDMFVELQLDMHSHTCPLLNKLKDKMHGKIEKTDLDATTRYELHTRLESMPKHNKVLHGDFDPSNIIISDKGVPFILDWSHAVQGNGAADAARSYLMFWLAGNSELGEKYLKLYCQKSDTAMQYVQKWMPIVAASQSVKRIESEKELLHRWTNVVEYE